MATATHKLDFQENGHIYRVDGQEKISVTRVLKDNRLYHDEDIPERNVKFGQERGTAVHRAIKLLVEEQLDVDTLDPQLVPFVGATEDWLKQTGFLVLYAEEPMYQPVYDYCGTPDLVGQFPDGSKAVVDAKVGSGKVDRWVGVQLSAYAYFYPNPRSYRRIALRLQEDGKFRNYESMFPMSELVRDWNAFLSALNLTNWRKATA